MKTTAWIHKGVLIFQDPTLEDMSQGDYTVNLHPFIGIREDGEVALGYGYRVLETGHFSCMAVMSDEFKKLIRVKLIVIKSAKGFMIIDLKKPQFSGIKKVVDRVARRVLKKGKPKTQEEINELYAYAKAEFFYPVVKN